MLLTVNMLIRFKESNIIERILWIDGLHEVAFTFDVIKNYSRIIPRKIKDIEEGISIGEIEIEKHDPFLVIFNEESFTKQQLKMRDKAYEIVSEIHKEPNIYYSSKRRDLIMNACKKFDISEKTVYKYLKKYWKGGMTKNSLLPNYSKCGGKGKEKGTSNLKRGRPRKYIREMDEGININSDIKKIFNVALDKYYYNSKGNSLTIAYELMKKEFFIEDYKIQNGIKIPILKDSSEIPTLGQFRYWYERERNLKKEISKRKSAKNYFLNNRAILGESTGQALGAGSLYQIDATIGDVYLVSRYRRDWIIGRPIIYIIADTFSRMITGLYIGLEGPSWTGASMTLANCAMDKVEFCKEYGIEIKKEEWPVHYIPDAIIADRGEFEGLAPEGLIEGLHVKIQNTSSFRGDMKGIIERYFHTINEKIKPFLPGFINEDFKQRGGRDYRLDAKLDIYDFTRIIIKCILYHNNHHYLKNYKRTELMIEDEVNCIPIELWNWGIKNVSGKLRYFPEDVIKLNLMPSDLATVTAMGIKLKNIYYSCEVGMKERWFEKARNFGSWKIKVCYDSRNMNYIYIKNVDGRSYEKCFLLEHQERYKDKTLEEIVHLNHMEKLNERTLLKETAQDTTDLMSEIEAIVKEADTKADGNKQSNKQKVKGIRKNRTVEKMVNRENESFELGNKAIAMKREDKSNNKEEEKENRLFNIDLLKKKQRERLNE